MRCAAPCRVRTHDRGDLHPWSFDRYFFGGVKTPGFAEPGAFADVEGAADALADAFALALALALTAGVGSGVLTVTAGVAVAGVAAVVVAAVVAAGLSPASGVASDESGQPGKNAMASGAKQTAMDRRSDMV